MTRQSSALLALLALLSSCAFADRTLWPTLAGETGRGNAAATASSAGAPMAPARAEQTSDPETELARVQALTAQRATEAQAARGALQDAVRLYTDAADAYARTPAMDPARPALAARVEAALTKRAEAVGRLAALAALAASDSMSAAAVASAARAAAAQPGISAAEQRRLSTIQRDAAAAAAEADRLVAELGSEVASESRQAAALRAAMPLPAQVASATPLARAAERRPLITIQFDSPDTAYDEELRYAVGEALRRRPNATFDVVAVAPPGGLGRAAKQHIEGVVRRLAAMGVPAERLTLSAQTRIDARGDEVYVYVR